MEEKTGAAKKERKDITKFSIKNEITYKNIPGVKIIYTRSTDVFVELHKRAEIAIKQCRYLYRFM